MDKKPGSMEMRQKRVGHVDDHWPESQKTTRDTISHIKLKQLWTGPDEREKLVVTSICCLEQSRTKLGEIF